MYLISFQHEQYCQGYEWINETVLVTNASSFEDACRKIREKLNTSRNFVNLTLDALNSKQFMNKLNFE